MKTITIDNINQNHNYLILNEKTQNHLEENYDLNIYMLEETDIVSAMGYTLLDTLEIYIENIIYKLDKLKLNIDTKLVAFDLIFESINKSTLYAINQGEIESIINRYNKTSYAFFPCNTFIKFAKYNNLTILIRKDNLILIETNNQNETIIELYEKLKNKEYKYLDEYIEFVKNKTNKLIKRK